MSLPSKGDKRNLKEKATSFFSVFVVFCKKLFSYIKKETVIKSKAFYKKASEFCKNLSENTALLCDFTGDVTLFELDKVHTFAKKCYNFSVKLLKPQIKKLVKFAKIVWNNFIKAMDKLVSKIDNLIPIIHKIFRKKGIKGLCKTFKLKFINDLKFRTSIINHTAPVLGVLVFCLVVSVFSNITYALSVEQGGEVVAFVSDEAVFTEAKNDLQTRLVSTTDDKVFELDTAFSLVSVSKKRLSDAPQVTDNLIRTSDREIVEADGLYVDDVFYGAVTNNTLIQSIFDETLDAYRSEEGNEKVEFAKNVELRRGFYLADSVIPDAEMIELLNSDVSAERTYTIKAGDSPTLIASKHGIPYKEFKKLNPTLEKRCMIGDEALIAKSEPFLSVKVTKEENYVEDIPYTVETTNDSSKNVGYTKVVQEGQNGSREVTAMVSYVDGIEDTREIMMSNTLEEPVTKKVIKGTKVVYSSGSGYIQGSTGSGKVSGNFIWPVGGSGGKISCYYGSRGHRGLDIAAPYGTAIVASASGRVVVSGWYYSYGKCVVIDHGNGVRTLYAHNSTLNVSVGQYVSQGQKIAGCGSTGYSTGNHCHFEVQVNGGTRNPLNYIG